MSQIDGSHALRVQNPAYKPARRYDTQADVPIKSPSAFFAKTLI